MQKVCPRCGATFECMHNDILQCHCASVRLIRENDTIAVPGEKPEESIAYQIAVQAVPELAEKELVAIPMPMTKNVKELEENHRRGVEKIEELLDAGKNVS